VKLTSSLPLLWIGPGLKVELSLGDGLGGLCRIHTIILGLHLALLVAGQTICTTVDYHLGFPVIFISMLRLVVDLRITTDFNFRINFSFGVNLDRDFWYIRGTAEKVGMSDSKLVLDVTLGKRFTAVVGSIRKYSAVGACIPL
jgi:hypothetical protein